MLGEPLRLTPSKTWGVEFLVPADAEVVVEGELLANERGVEAPFGEFPGYYGPQRLRPEIEVTNITRRQNPLFQHAFVGHPDNWNMGAVPKEGEGVSRYQWTRSWFRTGVAPPIWLWSVPVLRQYRSGERGRGQTRRPPSHLRSMNLFVDS